MRRPASGESSPWAWISSQTAGDLTVGSSPDNRMSSAAPGPLTIQFCTTEPCLKCSGCPLLGPLFGLSHLQGWESGREPRNVPQCQPGLDSHPPSRPHSILSCPLPLSNAPGSKLPPLLLSSSLRTHGGLQERSLDFCNPGDG